MRARFPFHLALAGEAASNELQTDPIGILQRGAFFMGESGSQGFAARVCLEAGAGRGIHVNARQECFECARVHTSTS
ncbi:MAG TPA: hypothetical protein VN281_00355 [Verrucomicrobiae bacterium]|nr:hypothetical protein [Verrucomicrobiae bacterium]